MARIKSERLLKSPKITVIGEGLTERWYFTHLRNIEGFKYDCKPRFFSEQSYDEMGKLVETVLKRGGIAVCVCDVDITRTNEKAKSSFKKLKDMFKDNDNVLICDSMPSIEFWFLLHFIDTSKYYNDSSDVISALRKWIPMFEKNGHFLEKQDWVESLIANDGLDAACLRAQRHEDNAESYSNVHKAIELFKL